MALLEIEIINWDKYNPKRDQKTYSWLRVDNSIGVDPELFGLDAGQKFLWIILLCEASKKNSGVISLSIDYLVHITGLKASRILETLEFLQQKPMCIVHGRARPRRVVDTTAPCSGPIPVTTPTYERTNVRTNVTNETKERMSEAADGLKPDQNKLPPIAGLWNAMADERLPRVREMGRGSTRKKACEERFKENPDEEYWRSVIRRINGSAFCLGENDRGWRADIDFLCRPDTHSKALEGKYDSKPGTATKIKTQEDIEIESARAEIAEFERARKAEGW